MKSNLLKISVLLSLLIVMAAFDTVSAGASKPFGGTIMNTKATEIQSLESSNYKCVVPGSSITIKSKGPKGAPTTYLIPAAVKSKTNTTARAGQAIKGLYSTSKTTITCIYQGYPPSTTTTQLTPITMYGTSIN